MSGGAKTITYRLRTDAIDRFIAQAGVDLQAAVRPAASAGAKVLYDEVVANVNAIGKKKGNLARSIYRVYSKTNSTPSKAVYHVSWNYTKAPHGRLLEHGWIQRYKVYLGKNGKWYTAIRPGMNKRKKPSRNAPQAVKDAYYVPLDGGPKQRPGYAFIRRAEAAAPRAIAAMQEELFKRMGAI